MQNNSLMKNFFILIIFVFLSKFTFSQNSHFLFERPENEVTNALYAKEIKNDSAQEIVEFKCTKYDSIVVLI